MRWRPEMALLIFQNLKWYFWPLGKFNFRIELYSFLKCFMLGTSELCSEPYLTVIKHFLFFISTFTLLKNYSVQEMPSFFFIMGEKMCSFLSSYFIKPQNCFHLNLKGECHFWSEAKILKSFWQKTKVWISFGNLKVIQEDLFCRPCWSYRAIKWTVQVGSKDMTFSQPLPSCLREKIWEKVGKWGTEGN